VDWSGLEWIGLDWMAERECGRCRGVSLGFRGGKRMYLASQHRCG